MGYDLYITDKDGRAMRSLAWASVFGSDLLEITIPASYSRIYTKVFGDRRGIQILDGMYCLDSMALLKRVMDKIQEPENEDAKAALKECITMAALAWDGYWHVDDE